MDSQMVSKLVYLSQHLVTELVQLLDYLMDSKKVHLLENLLDLQ